jgi:hypothetical protein
MITWDDEETLPLKSEESAAENPVGNPQNCLECGESYKIDHSAVAAKSRCVTEIVNIACIINA